MKYRIELKHDVARKMNRAQYYAARRYLRMVQSQLNKIPDMEEKVAAGMCDLMRFGKAKINTGSGS